MAEVIRKNSTKRSALLNALCSSKEHPSAEMLYEQLKAEYKDLSLGTVYRNLGIFCADGTAKVIATVGGKERYDGCVAPHAHFICRSCKRVIDIPETLSSENYGRDLNENFNYLVENIDISCTGLCDLCRKA